MQRDKDYTEIIERFLDGEMSASEEASFRQELSTNKELASNMEFYQLANSFVTQTTVISVQNELQNVQNSYKTKVKRTRNFKIAGGIGFLLSLGAAAFYFWKTEDKSVVEDSKSNSEKVQIVQGTEDTILLSSNQGVVQHGTSIKEEINTVIGQTQKTSNVSKDQETKVATAGVSVSKSSEADYLTNRTFGPWIKESTLQARPTEVLEGDVTAFSCDNVKINFTTQVNSTCLGESKGSVKISEVKGGKAPYQYSLLDKELNEKGLFSNLKQGEYQVQVQDVNQCETTSKVVVKGEMCSVDLYFNPEKDLELHFPVYEKEGELTIFDKKGDQKFTTQIEANSDFTWNGDTKNGKLLPGYYIFLIKYTDGRIQKGSVTLIP